MNKEYVEKFINQIEELLKVSDEKEHVEDKVRIYLKVSNLHVLLLEAREFMKYGEYEIALENTFFIMGN